MLPKLKILMLLAALVPVSLSPLPNATKNGPVSLSPLPNATKNGPVKCGVSKRSLEQSQDRAGDDDDDDDLPLAEAIFEFSKELKQALFDNPDNQGKNIVISPLSIHMGMMMVLLATPRHSATHRGIAAALGIHDSCTDEVLLNYIKIINNYPNLQGIDLRMANKMFIKRSFPVKQQYQDLLQKSFSTSVDFFENVPSEAIKQVNNFVAKETKDMIKDLMKPRSITGNTMALLVNAVYFKAEWLHQFDPSQTTGMEFTLHNGKTICVSQGMTQTSKEIQLAEYPEIESQVLELPYKNRFKMYVIKPNTNDLFSLQYAAKLFDYDEVKLLFEDYPQGLKITMPGFEVSYFTELVDAMTEMGMGDIFSTSGAELTEMTDKEVIVSSIIHETVVKVNEKGSEASAATGVCVVTRKTPTPRVVEFSVNWPFAFKIIDTENKVILFEGIILNPNGEDDPNAQ